MSDAGPFDAVDVAPPAPWGPRPMGQGAGLRPAPSDPNNGDISEREQIAGRVDRLESDHRFLLGSFGAAFVFLIVMFGSGYLALAAKIDSGFSASAQRSEALAASLSEVRTDVAVLKERMASQPAPSREPGRLD